MTKTKEQIKFAVVATAFSAMLLSMVPYLPKQSLTVLHFTSSGVSDSVIDAKYAVDAANGKAVPTQSDLIGYSPLVSSTEKEQKQETITQAEEQPQSNEEKDIAVDPAYSTTGNEDDTVVIAESLLDSTRTSSTSASPPLTNVLTSKQDIQKIIESNSTLPKLEFTEVHGNVQALSADGSYLALKNPTTVYRPTATSILSSSDNATVISERISTKTGETVLDYFFNNYIASINSDGVDVSKTESRSDEEYALSHSPGTTTTYYSGTDGEQVSNDVGNETQVNADDVDTVSTLGNSGWIKDAQASSNGRTLWYTST